jgi:hypothetical protein
MFSRVARSEWAPAAQVRIPDDQVTESAAAVGALPDSVISPAASYFTVTVNGMALDYDRVGTRVFDPMLLTLTDYLYDGKVISVPFVVSAKMIPAAADGVPRRMTFANTRVAGPHPYYGRLGVAVILYRVEREDYARRLLEAAQRACAAFDITGSVSAYLKMADAVLDGVDAVLGHAPTEPLLGFRAEFPDRAEAGTFAVLPEARPGGDLWLVDGVLSGGTPGALTPLAGISHVTYTVRAVPPVDLQTMPWFKLLWGRIVQWADIPNDEAKSVAQTYLGALYEELLTSPDIARDTVDAIYTEWENRARAIHAAARHRVSWGPAQLKDDPVRERVLQIREPW